MSDISRIERIFLHAVNLPDLTERGAYLASQCGSDADIRRRVEALLAAKPHAEGFLEPVASNLTRTGSFISGEPEPEPTANVGDRVGPYKLLEKIGEGGMGEVWVADQLEPIKRRVAIKLIKPGMDSRSVLGRFEAERQALAVMDHPNIAKVLDAGTTADGRPYFVMELVKGVPITEFADARKLTPKQRLELFVPVCQAIQHAHMKGIIHRDIKPSNVLVALHDETPVPKVIDFGVAKAVGQQLSEKTIYTGFGSLVGTPAYMAPEQATFNQLDVDTRADVYALGVLLYELLAGSPPIEKDRLKKAALEEVLRIVRDEEPPRPSQRLSTSQTKASIAAVRGSEPTKLSALMKGEIDWIVMKALEKDRTRRYESANSFAADVRRYLNGDAVEACPPTVGYRLRKTYRRNQTVVLVSVAFSLMLLTGAAISSWLAIQARRAETLAEAKRIEAEEQTAIAKLYADDYAKLSDVHFDAAVEAEIRTEGARIDSDLLEYKADPRVGLLRLARPLKDFIGPLKIEFPSGTETHLRSFPNHPELVKLREFQTAAVISAGQEFVPLLPPFVLEYNSDSYMVDLRVSPDGRLCFLGKEQQGLELVALPKLARLGMLREGKERVLQYGFSPDSQTAWTQDTDSVVRFWNADGTLRAKTPLRPERVTYQAVMKLEKIKQDAGGANPILVSDGVALLRSGNYDGTPGKIGPADLYSTRTGKFIRRLDRPGRKFSDWKLSPDNRWLIYVEDSTADKESRLPANASSQVVIVSAADGRELARLEHPVSGSAQLIVQVSPKGKWVLTSRSDGYQEVNAITSKRSTRDIRLWDTRTWQPYQDTALIEATARVRKSSDPFFVTDDVIRFWMPDAGGDGYEEGVMRIGQPGLWEPFSALGYNGPEWDYPVGEFSGTVIRSGRVLVNATTLQRLKPPHGRKYHPELAKLAPDGRFWQKLDTVTEKDLPSSIEGTHFPGFGRVMFRYFGNGGADEPNRWQFFDEAELRILPDAKRLDFPPELVELWAEIVVGGQLTPEGTFQPWDQPTWATKQMQLAAMKPPYPDFPFPGWAATEPNLWYRIRANQLKAGVERDKLIEQWRRTQPPRPDLGPDTWRTPEVAPPTREKK